MLLTSNINCLRRNLVADVSSMIKILRIFLSVGHPRDPKEERAIWVTIKKKRKKKPTFFAKNIFGFDFLDFKNDENTDVNLVKNGRFFDPLWIFEL